MDKSHESQPTDGYELLRRLNIGPLNYRSDSIAYGYMRRWTLSFPQGMLRLHKIARSDEDRHPHDHPMDFASLILSGGYVEFQPGQEPRVCKPGTLVLHRAEDLHYVKLIDGPSWSVLITSPRRRRWGFQTEEGWVDASEYDEWLRTHDKVQP